jgi:hypothetical protein
MGCGCNKKRKKTEGSAEKPRIRKPVTGAQKPTVKAVKILRIKKGNK